MSAKEQAVQVFDMRGKANFFVASETCTVAIFEKVSKTKTLVSSLMDELKRELGDMETATTLFVATHDTHNTGTKAQYIKQLSKKIGNLINEIEDLTRTAHNMTPGLTYKLGLKELARYGL